jgi:hypothetical protein
MAMLRHGDAGIELEDAQRDALATHRPDAQTLHEREGLDVGDGRELVGAVLGFRHGGATIPKVV